MKKIVVLSTYPAYPRKHGGQVRLFSLYHCLGHFHQVTIVSFDMSGLGPAYEQRTGNIFEITVMPTEEHQAKTWELSAWAGIPADDIMMPWFSHLTPEFDRIANRYLEDADVLVAAQPYLFHILEPYAGRKKLVYDSQNVEYFLKRDMLPGGAFSEKLLEQVYQTEKRACDLCDVIFACSEADAAQMTELYGIPQAKIVHVPNGVDLRLNPFVNYDTRQTVKQKFELRVPVATFIGSGHPPNQEAVRNILHFAEQMPDVLFFIMGGVCAVFHNQRHPNNFILAGVVDDDLKRLIYSISDIAINPMLSGSGTNLKVAEYMANGVPVISTPIGSRGYDFLPNKHLIVSDISDFPANIRVLKDNVLLLKALSLSGRKHIEENYSWDGICRRARNVFYEEESD